MPFPSAVSGMVSRALEEVLRTSTLLGWDSGATDGDAGEGDTAADERQDESEDDRIYVGGPSMRGADRCDTDCLSHHVRRSSLRCAPLALPCVPRPGSIAC